MTGSTTRRAATAWASWVVFPIDKGAAETILGCTIPDEAWQAIEAAYWQYSQRLTGLTASKTSRKKDDPQGWAARQAAATRALEDALARVDAVRSKHGDFLYEASANYSLQTHGYSLIGEVRKKLDEAFLLMVDALTIVERAEPIEIELPTEAAARDILVRDIFGALRAAGIEARASYGAALDQLERVTLTDLAPFEKLIAALQVGDEKRPAAFSAFVRAALAGEKRG
jgi:hypothetical protein